ncbi:PDZ domain-containing protein [Nocardioides gilvus]|uniref:YlbL family protein n=1 Tax=Nocardioides gilvus TaxID=1735589 RepID=UPI000D74A3F4|nr:PDZ domain-containing protein [Nocardioides gilvus]
MSQRTLAGILALPLVVALWIVAVVAPLPYIVYSPGITQDVLGEGAEGEIVQVADEETFRTDGELMLTAVYVTRPASKVNLFEVMGAWFDRDKAVLPYDAVYAPDQTREDVDIQGAVAMASSQDVAAAVALKALGREPSPAVEIYQVREGFPAQGKLEVGDVLVNVADTPIVTPQDVVTAVQSVPAGDPIDFRVRRDGKDLSVAVTPRDVDGTSMIGITPGAGYDFPFDVDINVDPNIGGSSAGLIFAMAIYDTLTPGSLTGGGAVAGTGTMAPDGAVGPIGGIAQKIASARDDGAELFLVPAANCDEALGARNGDMRLVKATNFDDALASVKTWVDDPDAALPSCERNADK